MKKIWTLAVVAALGISTIGCGETTPAPVKVDTKPTTEAVGDAAKAAGEAVGDAAKAAGDAASDAAKAAGEAAGDAAKAAGEAAKPADAPK